MRRHLSVIAAAAMLTACASEGEVGPQGPQGTKGDPGAQGEKGDPGEPGVSLNRSGSRIKARVGTTADGAQVFLGWFDADRGESCAFSLASDGKTRCLPALDKSRAYFADPQCANEPVALPYQCAEPGTCPTPRYVLRKTASFSTEAGTVFGGGAFDVTGESRLPQIYVLQDDGTCGLLPLGSQTSISVWTLSAELAPDSFAELTE